jgi:hypothetical protein
MTPEEVSMGMDQISPIEEWATPQSINGVQVLPGFINFY